MKVSREQMAENRQRILEAAGQLFREKGFEAVSVAEVMKAAGLTHGGFYGHFASKDDLIAQSLCSAIGAYKGQLDLRYFMDEYLSPRHRDNRAKGCVIAGLAADTLRQAPAARSAIADGVQAQIDWMSEELPGQDEASRRRKAIASWAAMVGATILARTVTDPALSDEILSETKAWIDEGLDRSAATIPEAAKSRTDGRR
jgi:TetR/AcrR family transcriptional regulator, transcriptional repressor for nem operon